MFEAYAPGKAPCLLFCLESLTSFCQHPVYFFALMQKSNKKDQGCWQKAKNIAGGLKEISSGIGIKPEISRTSVQENINVIQNMEFLS